MSSQKAPSYTDDIYSLKYQIQQMQKQIDQKDRDLRTYKEEIKRLNAQLKPLIRNIENQLKAASQIQKYLIPTEILQISGFDFSTKYISGPASGGDYFDIFKLKDKHRFAVIVASSSGHAMAALFLSVLIQLSSQIEAKRNSSPAKVLKFLSTKLSEATQTTDTSSVFLLIINRRTLEMTYCSAGDLMAWFQPYNPLQAGGDKLQVLTPSSPSLGLTQHKDLSESKLSLNAKDRIMIITPGIISALNAQNYSIENLLEQMKTKEPHDLRNEIIYQAQKQGVQKDMTAVVIDVKSRILKLT